MSEQETEFDTQAHYRHPDYPGVAWYVDGFAKSMADAELIYDEEGYYLLEVEPEEVVDEMQVYCVMVGDDRRFLFATDDLIKLGETDFCRECGQIGCSCVVYE